MEEQSIINHRYGLGERLLNLGVLELSVTRKIHLEGQPEDTRLQLRKDEVTSTVRWSNEEFDRLSDQDLLKMVKRLAEGFPEVYASLTKGRTE